MPPSSCAGTASGLPSPTRVGKWWCWPPVWSLVVQGHLLDLPLVLTSHVHQPPSLCVSPPPLTCEIQACCPTSTAQLQALLLFSGPRLNNGHFLASLSSVFSPQVCPHTAARGLFFNTNPPCYSAQNQSISPHQLWQGSANIHL